MRDKHLIVEEPCEGKLSRTVLKTSGTGDSLAEFNTQERVINKLQKKALALGFELVPQPETNTVS
jgi:hypothetical protein